MNVICQYITIKFLKKFKENKVMEFNFKSNSAYSYMRYGGYQGRYKGKEYYMIPNPEAS